MIHIHPVRAFESNYIWVIYNDAKQAIVVDPGDARPVLEFLSKLELELLAILVTHSHYDHVDGINDLLKHKPVDVYGPHSPRIPQVTNIIKEGDQLSLMNMTFQVLHTPGHLPEHVTYASKDEDGTSLLFCGDTLFSAGCGRIFDGTHEQLKHTLDRLASFDDTTKVYCTHEYTEANLRFAKAIEPENEAALNYATTVSNLRESGKPSLPTTVGIEKRINPFIRCDQTSVMNTVALREHVAMSALSALDVFKALREWKNDFR